MLLGRSPISWLTIFSFYIFYYACIAAFYSATVGLFYSCMDPHQPSASGEKNILKLNPGMGFAPKISRQSTLVYVSNNTVEQNVKAISDVLAKYHKDHRGLKKSESCHADNHTLRPNEKEACYFSDLIYLETGGCEENNKFGYLSGKPCVLVWLNNIYGFTPEPKKCSDKLDKESADKVGDRVKDCQILEAITKEKGMVYLSCQGETVADEENIKKIEYIPHAGFNLKYFPYLKQPAYLQPLVFVKVEVKHRFVPVIIACRAIAKNIEADPTHKGNYMGGLRFDLLVDI